MGKEIPQEDKFKHFQERHSELTDAMGVITRVKSTEKLSMQSQSELSSVHALLERLFSESAETEIGQRLAKANKD